MPVSPPQDRVFGPGVGEDFLKPPLGLSYPVQVKVALQVSVFARCNYFHVAAFRITHPAAQLQPCGFAVHEPAKAHALHAAFDEIVADHTR